ncbi:MAG: TetR/AcrR family transcriptional regulator [Clostridia bacterium]|nr:TetR/AcrR family transcriptional regulator [Clostridia bacterium]
METKHDTRTLRTRKHLAQSMLKLLLQKDLENINIVDICNAAQVHRTSFYNHFNDKYELFNYLFDEIKNEIYDKAIEGHSFKSPQHMYLQTAKNLIDFVDDNKDIFIQILKNNKQELIVEVFREGLERSFKFLIKQSGLEFEIPAEIIIKYYTGAFASLALFRIISSNKYTKEEYLVFFKKFILGTN